MSRPKHPEKIRSTRINLTETLAEALEEIASITGSTRSEVTRRILAHALAPLPEGSCLEGNSLSSNDAPEQGGNGGRL